MISANLHVETHIGDLSFVKLLDFCVPLPFHSIFYIRFSAKLGISSALWGVHDVVYLLLHVFFWIMRMSSNELKQFKLEIFQKVLNYPHHNMDKEDNTCLIKNEFI